MMASALDEAEISGREVRRPFPWRAYAQLVRLPNVFTAIADIVLAWAASSCIGKPLGGPPAFLLLILASACLYCGGMVWNDFFDLEQDQRERPFRPIPSGRIPRKAAGRLGAVLLLAGLVLAALAGGMGGQFWGPSTGIAGLLTLVILLYDGWLKRSWMGPLAMGCCRLLNVLLGLSLAGDIFSWGQRFYVALVVGAYIVGVTWFARSEARTSNRNNLQAAAGVMLAALFLALSVPAVLELPDNTLVYPYLLVALGFGLGLPIERAIRNPAPAQVQAAVKRAIFGLVALDAILATAFAGIAGLLLLLLVFPAIYLGRRLYST